jgi:hypothetical protein
VAFHAACKSGPGQKESCRRPNLGGQSKWRAIRGTTSFSSRSNSAR